MNIKLYCKYLNFNELTDVIANYMRNIIFKKKLLPRKKNNLSKFAEFIKKKGVPVRKRIDLIFFSQNNRLNFFYLKFH